MRLVSCHIDNFGKLSSYDKQFSQGINCILNENGSGKSTLAAFIRVMLYGLSGEKKRKDTEKERVFYKPWQGGTFGGTLTFEKDGVNYCIYRTFGSKESEDSFKIINESTGLEDKSFGTAPGIALFGIDGDSFERTAFVSQQDCATDVTDDISARIGGVSEHDDDMKGYEAAEDRLKKECDRLNPERSTGLIYKLKNELSTLKDSFRNIDSQKNLCEDLTEKRDWAAKKLNNDKERQANIASRLEALRHYLDLKEQKDNYENLKAARDKADEELRNAKSAFEGNIPDVATAKQWVETASLLRDDEKEIAQYELTPEEVERFENEKKRFKKQIPSSKEIDDLLQQFSKISDLKDELPDRRDRAELMKNSALEAQRQKYKPFILFLILGIIVILAGIAGAIFVNVFITAVCVIGIALIVVGCVLKKKHDSETRTSGEGSAREYNELMSKIAEDEEFVEGIEMDAQDLLGNVGIQFVGKSATGDLINLRNEVKEYENLGDKIKKHDDMIKEKNYEKRLEQIKEYARDCGLAGTKAAIPESNAAEICVPVSEIATRTEQIASRETESVDASKRVKVFEADHDVSKYEGLVCPEEEVISVDDLKEALDKCEKQVASETDALESYERELKGAEEKLGEMENAAREYDEKSEQLESMSERFDIVSKTRTYLSAARDNFNIRYIKDIQTAFDKYYAMLSDGDTKAYTIDANLNVTYVEQGQPRDPKTLSEGFKDLVGLCRRVAMADSMYSGEKPFLILDDPFVNLDDSKLSGASKFINDIASEYQIIYFTCQNSRKF